MTFRNVIVCHMVPGSESVVGPTFGHFDQLTRPQDLGVIGRVLLAYDDLYLHVIERREDPAVSGQHRGLPAFEKIAEIIAPYVTPYPSYWENPSHSVAREFYRWLPEGGDVGGELTVIVQRIKPGSEDDVARIFEESDAGPLPTETGVTGRWLYSIDDVFVHLLQQDPVAAEQTRRRHQEYEPAFTKIMEDLSPYLSPYRPEVWETPKDSVATPFYRWRAED